MRRKIITQIISSKCQFKFVIRILQIWRENPTIVSAKRQKCVQKGDEVREGKMGFWLGKVETNSHENVEW